MERVPFVTYFNMLTNLSLLSIFLPPFALDEFCVIFFHLRFYSIALTLGCRYLVYLIASIGLRIYWITMATNSLFAIIIGVGVAVEAYILRSTYSACDSTTSYCFFMQFFVDGSL
jgi:hypothetical protein